MNNISKYFDVKTSIITGLVILLLLLKFNFFNQDVNDGNIISVNGKKYNVIKHTTDTIFKTNVVTLYKSGETIYKDTTIYVNLPSTIDTTEIIRDFYSKNVYEDTLKLTDSLGYISIKDTIFKNRILGRTWNSHINQMIIKDSMVVETLPKIRFYLGGVLGVNKDRYVDFIGPSILVKNKKDYIFSLSAGFDKSKIISIQGGIYKEIKFGK